MPLFANHHDFTSDLDISSIAFWGKTFEERDETFAKLRTDHPVSWHPAMEDLYLTPEEHGETGFWAVTRAEDISYVSQNHELFSSELGYTALHPLRAEMRSPAAFLDADPPRHTEYRKLVSSSFTPKAVARLTEKIEQRASEIVDRVVGAGEIDFVEEVAAQLPMLTVGDLLGVPESQLDEFRVNGDRLLALQDPAIGDSQEERMAISADAFAFFGQLGMELIEARRKNPQDDLMSTLANGTVGGQPLDPQQIMMIMLLFSTAGNDTTKQTTTRTVMAFDQHPDQRGWLLEDFDGRIAGAIEEFVRYSTPVIQFNRTATRDLEFAGQQITEGDKVGIFYCSGNRDDRLFENPAAFDLSRPRNPHVAFGGGGVHYCLGNGVAKAQLRALFRNILVKLPSIEIGEPVFLVSNFLNGVRSLPVIIG
ncbi:cytochrome P450 [Nocardioides marmoriginsengisoli]|uniref:Cytochrome P450 n=1 Tax=Nocardioides marmoriginsengisoli TaxID=661483 RepID=A0A3N0CHS7_9ACTN|nr:cytochrome P450 [Nocardioides marmoriginsengisoli]RNL62859.1 cytochrome P450 [Nocardioides marmoriginsengisoli]